MNANNPGKAATLPANGNGNGNANGNVMRFLLL